MDDNTHTFVVHPEVHKEMVAEGLVKAVEQEPDEAEYSTYEEQGAALAPTETPVDPIDDDPAYREYLPSETLPKYYVTRKKDGFIKAITRAEYGKLRRAQLTRVYQRVPMCGHKFVPETYPRHRNCEPCLFAFWNVHGEYTKAVEELFSKHGKEAVVKLIGPKKFVSWRMFMSTVANMRLIQEAQARRSQEIKDSFIPPPKDSQ